MAQETQPLLNPQETHPIHSKSEKVCGTAFSVKKYCGKSAGHFWAILGHICATLGHFGSLMGHFVAFLENIVETSIFCGLAFRTYGEVCRRRRLVFYEIGQILMWAQHLYILYNLNVPPTGLAPGVHLPWLCYRMAHLTITNKLDSRRMW